MDPNKKEIRIFIKRLSQEDFMRLLRVMSSQEWGQIVVSSEEWETVPSDHIKQCVKKVRADLYNLSLIPKGMIDSDKSVAEFVAHATRRSTSPSSRR